MALQRSVSLSFTSRRCGHTLFQSSRGIHTLRPCPSHAVVQQTFRRPYSDAPTANLAPSPKPRRRFRFLRWTWRLTYVSAIGFVGWLTYTVWELRNPNDQFDPDPSKKTLVILGDYGLYKDGMTSADHGQGRAGAQCPYSRNSTRRITTLWLSRLGTTSSSPHSYPRVLQAPSSIAPLWSPFATFSVTRRRR